MDNAGGMLDAARVYPTFAYPRSSAIHTMMCGFVPAAGGPLVGGAVGDFATVPYA